MMGGLSARCLSLLTKPVPVTKVPTYSRHESQHIYEIDIRRCIDE